MSVTYIGHSGFLVETGSCYYLFDYFQGPLPPLNRDKPVIVLSSHSHHDHYNPAVFSLLARQGVRKIYPVLSSDIPPRDRPENLICRVMGQFIVNEIGPDKTGAAGHKEFSHRCDPPCTISGTGRIPSS